MSRTVKLWPIHLKPRDDELLSSWLVRLARAHGMKVHTFCDVSWPKKQIWNRDIDRSLDDDILSVLAKKTGTLPERVSDVTLSAYEGRIFEVNIKGAGIQSWVMPVGVYHRIRKLYGQQCCPLCLKEDEEPYFRRKWRIAFITVCERHRCLLIDKCPQCGYPINFSRSKLDSETITFCVQCKFDIRECPPKYCKYIGKQVNTQKILMNVVKNGWISLNNIPVYSHLFFNGFRQVVRLIATGKKSRLIQDSINREIMLPDFPGCLNKRLSVLECLSVTDRYILVAMAMWLLSEWPDRFIVFCRKIKLLSSDLLRDMKDVPYWYWKVIYENLYDASYKLSDEEILSAIEYLKQRGISVIRAHVSKLLGVTDVFKRKRKRQICRAEKLLAQTMNSVSGNMSLQTNR